MTDFPIADRTEVGAPFGPGNIVPRLTINKLLACLAFSLSILAFFFGDFEQYDAYVRDNQISVYDLALKIQQRETLVLVDLRSEQQRQEFSLPGAVDWLSAKTLVESEHGSQRPKPAPIIIYGHEGNRLWQQLHKQGFKLLFLNDGVEQWLGNIMSPVIYRLAPKHELQLFEQRAEISRYFGGLPRYSNEPIAVLSAKEQMEKLKRRGCGF